MTKLTVDFAGLAAYSEYLTSMKAQIDSSQANLQATLESIKGSWKGTDADTFVGNATAYLDNLKIISDLLETFGGVIGSRVSRYAQGVEAFYDALG